MESIDETSNYLEKETIILDVATNSLTSYNDFIVYLRDKFEYFESSTKERNLESKTAWFLSYVVFQKKD